MMTMIEILPLMLGVLLAQISPGPNMVAVSSFALGATRKAGVFAAAGVASGVFVWAILFAFGVGGLMSAFPQTITAMKIVGGSYLLYLAFKALRSTWLDSPKNVDAGCLKATNSRAYITGLLVVLTNPKAALMWVAISMFLASTNPAYWQFLVVGICASFSAMMVYGTYAVLFSTGAAVRTYDRFYRFIEASFGVVFGSLGVKLILDVVKELKA